MEEKIDYNAEPVLYCSHCLSLKIKGFGDMDYCGDCGSTDIDKAHVVYWDKLYRARYNESMVERKNRLKRRY